MKERVDIIIFKRGLAKSRTVASKLIIEGKVLVNDKILTKNSTLVADDCIIIVTEQPRYVSRGGLKLEKALSEFKVSPKGLIALDIGSSTGGFTDCLLQNGARKVYAIDVGTNQLDPKLKNHPQVVSLEKTDIRNIKNLPEKIDLAVIDVSFISLELILETVKNLVRDGGQIIALVKPQFETSNTVKNRQGIIKNRVIQEKALEKVETFCRKIGLKVVANIDSPILGGSGNKEYLLFLVK